MKRLMIYDANPGDMSLNDRFLLLWWKIGGFIMKLFGRIDDMKGVRSWKEAITWLNSHDEISSIQFWGHGSPGAIWIGSDPLVSWKLDENWRMLSNKLLPGAVFWIRACSVFRGAIGKSIAITLRDSLRCKVAGHVRIVGLIQPGLRTLSAGRSPIQWPQDPKREGWFPWDDRSVFCLRSSFPSNW